MKQIYPSTAVGFYTLLKRLFVDSVLHLVRIRVAVKDTVNLIQHVIAKVSLAVARARVRQLPSA